MIVVRFLATLLALPIFVALVAKGYGWLGLILVFLLGAIAL